eukprot:3995719-Pleurochrysis_carterae.AAC.1
MLKASSSSASSSLSSTTAFASQLCLEDSLGSQLHRAVHIEALELAGAGAEGACEDALFVLRVCADRVVAQLCAPPASLAASLRL